MSLVILKIGKIESASWCSHLMIEVGYSRAKFLKIVADYGGTYFNYDGGEIHFETEKQATRFLLRWS